MKGITRKIEYSGDWHSFWEIARAALHPGGAMLYRPSEERGTIIVPDLTETIKIPITAPDRNQ